MFSALAGMYMAAKVHMTEIKANITKKHDRQVNELIYKNKIDKQDETEKYKKSLLPESGLMTVEEYEAKSRALTKKEINAKIIDKAELPKDSNMVYVPQHKFKLVKYNEPVGSPELSLPRKLNFDRQFNAQGIVSGDFEKLVYPSVYYYADGDCVSCDLFVINLDPVLSDIEKVKNANVLNKQTKPILSTSKDTDIKFIFRTLTPIDFSPDNSKLIIKEKIGHRHDGIWKTELWVYDFNAKSAVKLPEIREAISYYWKNNEDINLDEKRWDIYPMGFDANNNDRIIVDAFAYTGNVPKFLGTWSIDTSGKESKLETLTGAGIPVVTTGFRLAEENDVIPISEIEFDAKNAKENEKVKQKQEKADKKLTKKTKKTEYKRKLNQMDMQTLIKIKERQQFIKQNKTKSADGITDNLGE